MKKILTLLLTLWFGLPSSSQASSQNINYKEDLKKEIEFFRPRSKDEKALDEEDKKAHQNIINKKLKNARDCGYNLQRMEFEQVSLESIAFQDNRLASSIFKYSSINDCSFLGTQLPHATFKDTSVKESKFYGTNLKEAVFEGCDASEAVFFGAWLCSAKFQNVTFKNNNFKFAKFNLCDMKNVKVCGGDFTQTVMKRINLKNTTFISCRFSDNLDLTGAHLVGTKFDAEVWNKLKKLEEATMTSKQVAAYNLNAEELGIRVIQDKLDQLFNCVENYTERLIIPTCIMNCCMEYAIDENLEGYKKLTGEVIPSTPISVIQNIEQPKEAGALGGSMPQLR